MAAKKQFLDVWILESDTVYREVPFDVVADWVVEGRLLEDDKTCPSGTKQWTAVKDNTAFRPYLPQPEPVPQPNDAVAAMEPVSMGLNWRRKEDDGDDDVDMIPLIDVSLVLLIFFIISASGAGAAFIIRTPETVASQKVDEPKEMWIAIDYVAVGEGPGALRVPQYYLGEGRKKFQHQGKERLNQEELLEELKETLARRETRVEEVVIHAHEDLPAKVVRELAVELEKEPYKSKIGKKYNGTREAK